MTRKGPRGRPRTTQLPMKVRRGRNAPDDAERARVALYDRAHAALFQRAYQAADIAEALGVSVSAISHLRSDLQAYSLSRRRTAEALLVRFFAWAYAVLKSTPDQGSTAATAAHTLGRHLRRQLSREGSSRS